MRTAACMGIGLPKAEAGDGALRAVGFFVVKEHRGINARGCDAALGDGGGVAAVVCAFALLHSSVENLLHRSPVFVSDGRTLVLDARRSPPRAGGGETFSA